MASDTTAFEPLDRLYYAGGSGGSGGSDRSLHVSEQCWRLKNATLVTDCAATHPPRGSLCPECSPDGVTVDDLRRAI